MICLTPQCSDDAEMQEDFCVKHKGGDLVVCHCGHIESDHASSGQGCTICNCVASWGQVTHNPDATRRCARCRRPVTPNGGLCRVHTNAAEYVEKHKERVDHPAHYGGDTVYETIKVLEAWLTPEEYLGALKFNVVKYVSRAGKKGDVVEDLKKAQWYLERAIAAAEAS